MVALGRELANRASDEWLPRALLLAADNAESISYVTTYQVVPSRPQQQDRHLVHAASLANSQAVVAVG